ncbi:MAG: MFS transporter, partial [Anaerolineae bacterium]|nr:MFS transporter [Anaerolineae bacterium]
MAPGSQSKTRIQWQLIAPLLAVQVLVGAAGMPARSFFPIYLEERFLLATVAVSILVAARQVTGMISAVIGGSLADTLGPKLTLIIGLTGYVAAGATFLVRPLWLITLLWCMSGLAMSLHTLGGMSYLIASTEPNQRGTFSALYSWGIPLGSALISPGLGVVLDRRGYTAFGLILIGTLGFAFIVAAMFLKRTKSAARGIGSSLVQTLQGYSTIIRRPLVGLLGMLRFLPTCYYGMSSVLIPLLIYRLAGNKTSVAIYSAASQISAALVQILVGRAADRWGRKWPQVGTMAVMVGSAFGLAAFSQHVWSFYVFGVLGNCAAWSLSALLP